MHTENIKLPSASAIKLHILHSLSRYWPSSPELIANLPVYSAESELLIKTPLTLCAVSLPDWATSCGVDGIILIPEELMPDNYSIQDSDLWKKIDWFLASFLLLEGWHERLWEAKKGPIHSYSHKLKGWDERVWQHAWVNRIALFFRAWTSHLNCNTAEVLLGKLPKTRVLITHDVDVVEKTFVVRLKQGIFTVLNAILCILHGNFNLAWERAIKSIKFFFGKENWWKFDELLSIEKAANVHSTFHFYADSRSKTLKRWFFDPGYDVNENRIKKLIIQLRKAKHQIGIHPSFDSWESSGAIAQQKKILQDICKVSILSCRQHWLRFSWKSTWLSQELAGLRLDTTLMFNNRPGFRNASAIYWHPWCQSKHSVYILSALPTMLMDSHLYDYQHLTYSQRKQQIRALLTECYAVRGVVALLWHPHTFADDYGWKQGFVEVLEIIGEFREV
jgi:hypothetical protein